MRHLQAGSWLVLWLCSLTAADITASVPSGLSIQIPTMRYFGQSTPTFDSNSSLLFWAQPATDAASCTFLAPKPERFSGKPSEPVVAAVGWPTAYVAGCRNYRQVVDQVQAVWSETLPPLGQVLISTNSHYADYWGGPLTDRYLSRNVHVRDGAPSIPVSIMSNQSYTELHAALPVESVATVSVVDTAGPWNSAFGAVWFAALRWTFVGINALLVLLGLARLAQSIRCQSFIMEKRSVIFVCGLVSEILYTVTLALPFKTWSEEMCFWASLTFYFIAFYLLLLLWNSVLSRAKGGTGFNPMLLLVFAGMFLSIVQCIVQIVSMFVWTTKPLMMVRVGLRWAAGGVMVLVALYFMAHTVHFHKKVKTSGGNRELASAMQSLMLLAMAGFFGFLVEAITDLVLSIGMTRGQVSVVAAMFFLRAAATTFRCGAILLILGVKIPEDAEDIVKSLFKTSKSFAQTRIKG